MAMKVNGRYGRFTPRPVQQPFYAKRANRQEQQRRELAANRQAWLAKHRACANGASLAVAVAVAVVN